jgi:hypothetical protein
MSTRRAAHRARASILACSALMLVACGGAVRTVPSGPHGPTAPPAIVVDTPPPAAKTEWIPKDPGRPCAWLDGRWDWVDEAWHWTPGAWVVAPRECYFAPPEALWVSTTGRGLLFYLPGRWYPASGTASCATPQTCGATSGR